MPGKSAPVRLSKAAKEFNVGLTTIVDYLKSKGIEIESNPNSKIDNKAYEILQEEFLDSKKLKEKAQKVGVRTGKRETVTLEKDRPAPEPKAEEEDAILIKNVQGSAEDEVIKPRVEKKQGLNILGKIDLNKPRKPEPKPAEPAAVVEPSPAPTPPPAPAPTPDPTPTPVEAPEAVQKEEPTQPPVEAEKPTAAEPSPAPVEEKKPEDAARVEKAPEIETIRTNFEKLAGLTVVGRIELPEKRKKPVMSTDPETETQKGKRKRKRIIAKPEAPSTTGGQQRPGNKPQDNRKPKGKPTNTNARQEVSQEDIDRELKQTLAKLSGAGTQKGKGAKMRRQRRDDHRSRAEELSAQEEMESTVLRLTEFVTVSDLANLMTVSVTEVISACMSLGIMASINQRLDAETITIVAEEFGYTVEFTSAELQEAIPVQEDEPLQLQTRAPIVTVMGHVDHGKTSLLDHLRKENVMAGEAGGITQHIGAYSVKVNDRTITFLDTPGHEAFTAMRARGAQVTDLAIIVVAADDDVMPQTKEAINHAQAAGIPMVFAINKIDKPNANPEKIKEQLAGMNILVEDWGGKYQSQEISAKFGNNVDLLLEKVLLEADLLDLKANPDKRALGTVIESSLDKGRGYVTTLLVEAGTMRIGDVVLAGHYTGRVKAMFNELGKEVKEVGPSQPVSMLGLSGAPNAGDKFNVLQDEREARTIAAKREQLQREQGVRARKHVTLDEIGRRIAIGDFKELNIILKGDVDGSVEALADSMQKLSTDKIQVNVIHKAVGQITESDVLLATASDAIIVGFQVRPSGGARRLAEKEEIQIKLYSVIYAAIDEVRDAMEGMLSAKIEERIVGNAEVRDVFKISKVGTVAGCFVTDGKINRNSKIRLIRDGIVVYSGSLGSLKRFKDDVKEVNKGYECGLNIDKFNDIKVGDILEAYEEYEVKQTL